MSDSDPEPNAEDYLQLLVEHERPLEMYVHSLVNSADDADDIVQECKVVMWRHFGKFDVGTNFLAWARKIALNQILNYRRKEKRRATSAVDQAFIESVAAEIEKRSDHLEHRAEALRDCLRKLPQAHRQAREERGKLPPSQGFCATNRPDQESSGLHFSQFSHFKGGEVRIQQRRAHLVKFLTASSCAERQRKRPWRTERLVPSTASTSAPLNLDQRIEETKLAKSFVRNFNSATFASEIVQIFGVVEARHP